VYLTLYVSQAINRMTRCTSKDAVQKEMYQLGVENFTLPTDSGFPLAAFYKKVENKADADALKAYLMQARQEVGSRLTEVCTEFTLSHLPHAAGHCSNTRICTRVPAARPPRARARTHTHARTHTRTYTHTHTHTHTQLVIDPNTGRPSKWWMCFTKRKFLGKSLEGPGGDRR
jgi:hypothetical protein